MNILVIGNGAREHALLWKLAQSPQNVHLYVAPGNAGMSQYATVLPIPADHIEMLSKAAMEFSIDITLVGPEGPLSAGIVDYFQGLKLPIFGPTKSAARIETSKAFSKELMASAGVPTADFQIFDTYRDAKDYVLKQGVPIVIKADGLAAGKGVVIAESLEEAFEALDLMMVKRAFGLAGNRVVIEKCLVGQEVSIFGFIDGVNVSSLVAACDYKRIGDRGIGSNTGGMGAYSPPLFWTASLEQELQNTVMRPIVNALAAIGAPYTGILYGGIILTENGPQVLEFNARFGDPETQVILPRLDADLVDVIQAVLEGSVSEIGLQWSDEAQVGVVMASKGYPDSYETGKAISIPSTALADALIFHSGTTTLNNRTVTSGGRVLTVVGHGASLENARTVAYDAVNEIEFDGAYYRTDIALFD